MNIFELTRILNEMNDMSITSIESAKRVGAELKRSVDKFINTNVDSIRATNKREEKNKIGKWMVNTVNQANSFLGRAAQVSIEWNNYISDVTKVTNANVIKLLNNNFDDVKKTELLKFVRDNSELLQELFRNIINANGKKISILDYLNSRNALTDDIKTILFDVYTIHDYNSQPRIGKGEVLTCLLFGGEMIGKESKGDVQINNQVFEVKTHKGIIGQQQRVVDINYFKEKLMENLPLIYVAEDLKVAIFKNWNDYENSNIGYIEPKVNSRSSQDLFWKLK